VATLGSRMKMIIQPQGGCVICFREIHKTGATALRLKDPITPLPQGSRDAATLGFKS